MTGRITRTTPPPVAASDGTTGVYGITVTAQLTGMSVQALRLYERKGLLQPDRTTGGTRRYSDTGIARILGLEADNTALHHDNTGLRTRNADLTTSNTALKASNTALENDNTALRSPRRRPRTGNPG